MTSLFSRSKRNLRTGAGWLGAALMLACHAVSAAGTAQPQYTGDLIIKWRDDTSGTQKPLSATEAGNRLLSVAQAAGSTLQVKRTLATDAQLMRTGLSDATSIEAAAAKVAQDARVAYVVPDRILYPTATPNDPLFSSQNNLQSPTVVAGGINVAAAWDITQGRPAWSWRWSIPAIPTIPTCPARSCPATTSSRTPPVPVTAPAGAATRTTPATA